MSGHELIFGRRRKRSGEMSRDVTLYQLDQACALPTALHGHQATKLRISRRVFDKLAHDGPQLRSGIDSLKSSNAVTQPGEKTDGEFIRDRHPKLFLRRERELARQSSVLGDASRGRSFEHHRRKSLASCRDDARASALDGLARRARSASTGFAEFRGFSRAKKELAKWQIIVLYVLPSVKHA
jgi:hypothetical protein